MLGVWNHRNLENACTRAPVCLKGEWESGTWCGHCVKGVHGNKRPTVLMGASPKPLCIKWVPWCVKGCTATRALVY